MSAWRRKAIALFSEQIPDLDDPEFTVHWVFFDLLPLVREAHHAGDDSLLRKIYGYAEWCLYQQSGELSNAAVVAFYEHLPDDHSVWEETVRWLSPYVVESVKGLWESTLRPQELREVLSLLVAVSQPRYQESVFHTNEITAL